MTISGNIDVPGVRLARQPDTLYGSSETLIVSGVEDTAAYMRAWMEFFDTVIGDASSVPAITERVAEAARYLDLRPFAEMVERNMTQGMMLGALDAQYEQTENKLVQQTDPTLSKSVWLQVSPDPSFAGMPFAQAAQEFMTREPILRGNFEQLSQAAKRRAFTIAGATSQAMVATIQKELGRQIAQGGNLREFKKFMRSRIEAAGFVSPKGRNEVIFRTNVLMAYNSGRYHQMMQPAVLKERPVWEIRCIRDSRTRPTHYRLHGTLLEAVDGFFTSAFPPFGYNCRCRVVSRRRTPGQKITQGKSILGIPDPGFTSGTRSLIQPPLTKPIPPGAPPTSCFSKHVFRTYVFSGACEPPLEKLILPEGLKPDPKGSNQQAGWHKGADGKMRYVKVYKESSQAYSEHLTGKIYKLLGVDVPQTEVFTYEGKIAFSSEAVSGELLSSKLSKEAGEAVYKGYVGDVFTANWDALGLTLDNVMIDKGIAYRIDNGAGLLFRAQGTRKPDQLLDKITEWDNFLNPNINKSYTSVLKKAGIVDPFNPNSPQFGGIANRRFRKQLLAQFNKFEQAEKEVGGWSKFVDDTVPNMSEYDRTRVKQMLESRSKLLKQKKQLVLDLEEKASMPSPAPTPVTEVKPAVEPPKSEVAKVIEPTTDKLPPMVDAPPPPPPAPKPPELVEIKPPGAQAPEDLRDNPIYGYRRVKTSVAGAKPRPTLKSTDLPQVSADEAKQSFFDIYEARVAAGKVTAKNEWEPIVNGEMKRLSEKVFSKSGKTAEIVNFTGSGYEPIREAEALFFEFQQKFPNYTDDQIFAEIQSSGRASYGRLDQLKYNKAKSDKITRRMKKAIEDGDVIEGTVYRGLKNVPMSAIEKMIKDEEMMLGKKGMPGTASSSWTWNTASGFANNINMPSYGDDAKVMLVIHTKTGVPIQAISNYPTEKEILLRRDARYRVLNCWRAKEGPTNFIFEIEEIDEAAAVAKRVVKKKPPKAPGEKRARRTKKQKIADDKLEALAQSKGLKWDLKEQTLKKGKQPVDPYQYFTGTDLANFVTGTLDPNVVF